ncbi:type II TA system antitoxin MqsA family protein [Burkholderia gladioli]|uniref:type II TA system antitoxin MqsA family protein n=1 Tax=Burkholderia gladioli TaxID=28095 RepID=UPI00163F17B6|nr:type II TA system antitoxin MqsA family protein [Burkholderia gladioli]
MDFNRSREASDPVACPRCGSDRFIEISYSDTEEFRGLHVDVDDLHAMSCTNCGMRWVTALQRDCNDAALRSAFSDTRDDIRKKQGLLQSINIAEIRHRFGLSQKDAALIFGGGANAFNKYESGEVLQSQAMDKLLRLSHHVGQDAVDFLVSYDPYAPFLVEGAGNTNSILNRLVEDDEAVRQLFNGRENALTSLSNIKQSTEKDLSVDRAAEGLDASLLKHMVDGLHRGKYVAE